MVHAYILVQTDVGKSRQVADAIGSLAGVTETNEVTGPYDIIARIEAESVDTLGRNVIAEVQKVSGISRTLTCTVVHS